jgi:type III secretion protein T
MIDYFSSNADSLRHFIYILALHLPRAIMFIFFFPLFGKALGAGGFLKVAVAATILLAPVSTMLTAYDRPDIIPIASLFSSISEVLLGCLLGLTMAIPYYVFKAYGAFIDVYRGATFAAQAGGVTDTGSEELPLEQVFGLMFAAMIFAGPGMHAICTHLLESYKVLPPGSIDIIELNTWAQTLVLLLADHVIFAFILSGPILIIILLVEIIMQVLSAFTQQMQLYSLQFGFRSIAGIGALLFFLHYSEDEIMYLLSSHSYTLTNLIRGFE